jgi:tRNA(Ile)-lysidine synthase
LVEGAGDGNDGKNRKHGRDVSHSSPISHSSHKPRRQPRLPSLTLDPRGLAPPGAPALIGVSGGRDSAALLHALVERGESALVVCHFDHGLRPESADEAEFVAKLARGYGLPCEIERRVAPLRKKQSVETAAREARYAFFSAVATRRDCAHLYLAHHADDQAETLLFNLLRGSGTAGLCGMRPTSRRGALTLHRPLLGTWREEIDRYVDAHALRHCEDPTNLDLRHTRNRMRHEIIPFLEKALERNVRSALWRSAEILGAEDELLNSLAPPVALAAELEVAVLRALPTALQRRAVEAWLGGNGVPNVSFDDVENVLRLVHQRTPAKVNLSSDRHARRRAGRIFLEP